MYLKYKHLILLITNTTYYSYCLLVLSTLGPKLNSMYDPKTALQILDYSYLCCMEVTKHQT